MQNLLISEHTHVHSTLHFLPQLLLRLGQHLLRHKHWLCEDPAEILPVPLELSRDGAGWCRVFDPALQTSLRSLQRAGRGSEQLKNWIFAESQLLALHISVREHGKKVRGKEKIA